MDHLNDECIEYNETHETLSLLKSHGMIDIQPLVVKESQFVLLKKEIYILNQ